LLTLVAIALVFASVFPQYAQSSPPGEDIRGESTGGDSEDIRRMAPVADPIPAGEQKAIESPEPPEVKKSDAEAEAPSALKSGEAADGGVEEATEEEEIEAEFSFKVWGSRRWGRGGGDGRGRDRGGDRNHFRSSQTI